MSPGHRPVALCADDFGIAPGVDTAILDLARNGRLSALSCMTMAGAWRADAPRLRDLPDAVEIGLHIVLTSRTRTLGSLAIDALLGRLDPRGLATEIECQIDGFETALGRSPDFIDGHLHVHELPRVRAVVAAIWRRRLGRHAWIRNTATPASRIVARPVARLRSAVLSTLGSGARRIWRAAGATTNDDFSGVRDFDERAPYRVLMRHFLAGARPGLLVMCHPGIPDSALADVDPVVEPRAHEYDYLASDAFLEDLDAARVHLAPLGPRALR